jgi:hypothetical protein
MVRRRGQTRVGERRLLLGVIVVGLVILLAIVVFGRDTSQAAYRAQKKGSTESVCVAKATVAFVVVTAKGDADKHGTKPGSCPQRKPSDHSTVKLAHNATITSKCTSGEPGRRTVTFGGAINKDQPLTEKVKDPVCK